MREVAAWVSRYLDGHLGAVGEPSAVHLRQRSRGDRLLLEERKASFSFLFSLCCTTPQCWRCEANRAEYKWLSGAPSYSMNTFLITVNSWLGTLQDHPSNHAWVSTLRGE